MSRCTYRRENGEWGIRGVDLAQLPPGAYGALHKLKDLEDLLEGISTPGIRPETRSLLVEELLEKGRADGR